MCSVRVIILANYLGICLYIHGTIKLTLSQKQTLNRVTSSLGENPLVIPDQIGDAGSRNHNTTVYIVYMSTIGWNA